MSTPRFAPLLATGRSYYLNRHGEVSLTEVTRTTVRYRGDSIMPLHDFLRAVDWIRTDDLRVIDTLPTTDLDTLLLHLPSTWTWEPSTRTICSPNGLHYRVTTAWTPRTEVQVVFHPSPPRDLRAVAYQEPANALKAKLGGRFHCYVCRRQHQATRHGWHACTRNLVFHRVKIPDPTIVRWDPDIEDLIIRHDALVRRQTWLAAHDTDWQDLLQHVRTLRLTDSSPEITPEELSQPDGLERFVFRVDTWQRDWQCRIEEAQTRLTPLRASLERLLPLLHPAGLPHTVPSSIPGDRILAPSTQAEINRILALVAPYGLVHKPSQSTTGSVRAPIRVEVPLHRVFRDSNNTGNTHTTRDDVKWKVLNFLRQRFAIEVTGWTGYHQSSVMKFRPEQLDLDPAFWSMLTYKNQTLWFRSQPVEALSRPLTLPLATA